MEDDRRHKSQPDQFCVPSRHDTTLLPQTTDNVYAANKRMSCPDVAPWDCQAALGHIPCCPS